MQIFVVLLNDHIYDLKVPALQDDLEDVLRARGHLEHIAHKGVAHKGQIPEDLPVALVAGAQLLLCVGHRLTCLSALSDIPIIAQRGGDINPILRPAASISRACETAGACRGARCAPVLLISCAVPPPRTHMARKNFYEAGVFRARSSLDAHL